MELTIPTALNFGAFRPFVADTYLASGTARVSSTTGDASVSVSDPSTTNIGRLVNGDRGLASALQLYAASTNVAATVGAGGAVTAAGTPLISFNAPVTNSAVTLTARQAISATEVLRAGTYSKSLTFTLSTTTP
jgi:hypothetical protein